MPRSPSWIDPDAFAALEEATPEERAAAPDAAPTRIEPPVPTAPPLEPSGPRATLQPPLVELAELDRRVRLFQRWMQTLVGERPFFVADAEGHVLIAQRVPAERVVAGPVFERALRVLRPFVGAARTRSAHVELEDGQLLQMVWHRTDRGRIGLGVFGNPVLDPARIDWVARALEKVFAEGSAP